MFHKDTMVSANAYRCEILVCEQKVIIKGKKVNKSISHYRGQALELRLYLRGASK